MNPRSLSIIALGVLVIAGGIAWLNRPNEETTDKLAPGVESRSSQSSRRGNPSLPHRANPNPETREEREAREALAVMERNLMTSMWLQSTAVAFQTSREQLVTDHNLSPEQSEQLIAIFDRRQEELTRLLGIMTSGDAADEKEIFRQITALIRNKDLRADLENVLSAEQLKAFDEAQAKQKRETHEARAYRDLAAIHSVVKLADSQKPEVLGVLMQQAAERVEQEADSRAFMSLMYGGLASQMDSSLVRGLTGLVDLDPAGNPDFDFGGTEHGRWVEEQNAKHIESELSPLKNVLTDQQLARYREHLEEKPTP